MIEQRACDEKREFIAGLQGLVFDVDGVIFDSRGSNMEFYNLVRRSVQLPPLNREQEDYCQMATFDEALKHIIPKEFMPTALEACRQINYEEQILPLLTLEPGLLELLHWLQQWDVLLAIFTNRNKSVIELLRYFGLESFFAVVKTSGDCPPKPNPEGLLQILAEWDMDPCQIAFLGDSKVDEMAAFNAGVPFWAFKSDSLNARLHIENFYSMITWITPLVEGQ